VSRLTGVLETVLYVDDLDQARSFYERASAVSEADRDAEGTAQARALIEALGEREGYAPHVRNLLKILVGRGRITEIGPGSATVMLLTDAESTVIGQLTSNAATGEVVGQLGGVERVALGNAQSRQQLPGQDDAG